MKYLFLAVILTVSTRPDNVIMWSITTDYLTIQQCREIRRDQLHKYAMDRIPVYVTCTVAR